MTKLVDWRSFLLTITIVGGLAFAAAHFFGFSFIPAFVVPWPPCS